MKKKFLALVMTLSMVLSLVPMTALAAEEGTAPATQEGQSVGADATGNGPEGDAGTSDTLNENLDPGGNDTGNSENSDGDASQDWKVDKENKTIEIYNATGLGHGQTLLAKRIEIQRKTLIMEILSMMGIP